MLLFPPINPPAWTKMQSLIPLSSDSASSRMPRHSSSRESLGQEDRRGGGAFTDGCYMVSCSLPAEAPLIQTYPCANINVVLICSSCFLCKIYSLDHQCRSIFANLYRTFPTGLDIGIHVPVKQS